MKLILAGTLAFASIGAAHAQTGSISWSATGGTGSAQEATTYYSGPWPNELISIHDGTASASFKIRFEDGEVVGGYGGGTVVSQDGKTQLSASASSGITGSTEGYADFWGDRSSGNGSVSMWEPSDNGSYGAYFRYLLQANGLYTITGGSGYYFEFFWGDTDMSADWEFHDVAITFDNMFPVVVPDPVPEPAAWAMMIGGFGLAGMGLRHRRARIRYA